MRILVYEHFTALGERAPRSLRAEGGAMLAALVADLATAGHEIVTFAGPGKIAAWLATAGKRRIDVLRGVDPGPARFRRLLAGVEAAWVIAPETGGILRELNHAVLAAGRRLLGSAPAAVELAASKLATCRVLSPLRVRCVPTLPLPSDELPAEALEWGFPVVVKPDDGVGSEGVGLARSAGEVAGALCRAARHSRSIVVQPYVDGTHASVSLLGGPAGAFPLALQSQDMRVGASFSYRGGEVPLEAPAAGEALALARAACAAIPGLAGFVGVDLVLAGSGPLVIEVNPRLTTAYLGLRRASRVNLAAVALDVLNGKSPEPVPVERRARFTAAGRVTMLPRRSDHLALDESPLRRPEVGVSDRSPEGVSSPWRERGRRRAREVGVK
jgi:predicted ATP-grasp superfamily ATP-dependent carboligase